MGTPGLPWDHPDSDPAADIRAFIKAASTEEARFAQAVREQQAEAAFEDAKTKVIHYHSTFSDSMPFTLAPSSIHKSVGTMTVFEIPYGLYKVLDKPGLVAVPELWRLIK